MPRTLITDLYIQRLECPVNKTHLEVFDTDLIGFYVDVQISGRKSFRMRIRIDRKLRVVTIGDASILTVEEARKIAHELLRKARLGVGLAQIQQQVVGPTIEEFFLSKYLPYVKSYKRSWISDDSMVRNHIVPKIGALQMGGVSAPDVAVFLEKMKSQSYAVGTCNRALVLLRYGFELAIRWKTQGVEANPVKEIKNLKDDNRIERYLSNDQAEKLLSAVKQSESEMLQHIVLFLIYTGARKREVLDARWKDIDWDQRSWRIPKTKSGKVRHVPLSSGAYEVLNTLKKLLLAGHWGAGLRPASFEQVPDQFIFMNTRTGKAYVSFYYSWHAARNRAGMPEFRVHDLRHSFASFLVNAGRSLYEVQDLLGHSDIRTTSRYAHLSRERLISAVQAVPLLGQAGKAAEN
jgi:integrase